MTALSVADPVDRTHPPEQPVDAPIPTARHFVKSVFRFGVAQIISWVAGAALVVMLPRFLGDAALGKLGFAIAITSVYGLLADPGISYFMTKEIARAPNRAGEILSSAILVRSALSVIAASAVVATVVLLGYDPAGRAVAAVLALGMLVGAASTSVRGTLVGLHKMRTVAAAPALSNFVYAGGSAAVFAAGGGVVWVAAASVVGQVAAFALNLKGLAGQVRWTPPSWRVSRYLIGGGLPFVVTGAALVIYGQIDTVMLSLLTRDAVVGWYVAAVRIMSVPQFVPAILTIVLFPALSAATHHPESYNRIIRQAIRLVVLVNLPVAVGIGLLADQAIHVLGYPASFDHSIVPLVLLAAGIPLVAIDMVIGAALGAGDRQKYWAAVGVAAAVLNPALNLFAIPFTQRAFGNGAIGTAAITTITEMFILVLGLKLLPHGSLGRETYSYAARCLLAAALLAAVLIPLREMPSVAIPIVAGAVAYVLASMALRTLTMADIRMTLGHLIARSPS